ncbi:osteopetrosis-associated transmembrane protein 1 [Teleopsis dalmanni]|uniref:osteopetrosis-associated transmembrane protein 1 n=1 Tax=Teleopsis dalmanni TaxID=139649 RepID=UPI0018CF5ACD|nr:osteopetrosis-associated transmembrane protein 1 [Teleopsis dalmanni]
MFKYNIYIVIIICFFANGSTNESVKNVCVKLLHSLAAAQGEFVRCSTVHAVPVRLCLACELSYANTSKAYENLENEKNCTNKYFDKDRINIVLTTQSILIGLWDRAFCNDCFSSNNSEVFDNKLTKLTNCLNQHKSMECVACLSAYVELNSFYQNIDQHNNGKVCYDLQDAMNRTRNNWSKELRCCHREFKITFFMITTGIITCLFVIFYGGIYTFTKRQEANHDILINEDQNTITQTQSAVTVPQ